MEVFVDDAKVLNVNQWICDQLLPEVKKGAKVCLDLHKVIQGNKCFFFFFFFSRKYVFFFFTLHNQYNYISSSLQILIVISQV